jgi:hypothetical protein|tara:strand:+ start:317 stop:745 length:429 start_codon:yes stop_codon:yes gene_type:complete
MIDKIQKDLKSAMKNKDKVAINTLRGLISIFNNQNPKDSKNSVENIIKKEVKKRKEAIELYQQNNRNDLKENEENELSILESYLPDQINEIELEQKINQLKSELFNNEKPNIGILIKNAISKFNSVSDNGTISKICRKILEQ